MAITKVNDANATLTQALAENGLAETKHVFYPHPSGCEPILDPPGCSLLDYDCHVKFPPGCPGSDTTELVPEYFTLPEEIPQDLTPAMNLIEA